MITAIVLTKDEEKNIVDCIDGLGFCSEIIIIDDYSIDKTFEIIENLSLKNKKLKVFKRQLDNDFSEQRRFGIGKSSNDWIFFVDADERITPELATEIKENLTVDNRYGGYLIPRHDFMWGKSLDHGETGNIKLLRLFNKNNGKLEGKVHEIWVTKKDVGRLINPILHYPHPTVSEFLREINFYTDLRAKELYDKKVKVNAFSIILYPCAKFIRNFIFKRGFLDGVAGLVHAILMSFHSFLVRGKLWFLWQDK